MVYVNFEAEIIEVKVKKTASVDKEIKIVLVTDNVQAIELQKYIAEKAVKVNIE